MRPFVRFPIVAQQTFCLSFFNLLIPLVFLLPAETEAFIWQSKNTNLSQLSEELSDLYINLALNQKLPIQGYLDKDGATIEGILRKTHLFYGSTFPARLNHLLCTLNSHICTNGNWTNRKNDLFFLPLANIQTFYPSKPVHVTTSAGIRDIVTSTTGGCTTLDDRCKRLIQNNNRRAGDVFAGHFPRTILLPILQIRAYIDVPIFLDDLPEEIDQEIESTQLAAQQIRLKNTLSELRQSHSFDSEKLAEEARAAQLIVGIESSAIRSKEALIKLNEHILTRIISQPFSLPPSLHATINARFKRILSFIHHPLSPNQAPGEKKLSTPVIIGIVEEFIDNTHCALSHIVKITASTKSFSETGSCGELGPTDAVTDHGTHVAGLIAGKLTNSGEFSGINTKASVLELQASLDGPQTDEQLAIIHDRILYAINNFGLSIVNFSSGYAPLSVRNIDPLVSLMKDRENEILFVAAASEEKAANKQGRDVERNGCNWRPACLQGKNIISVIALAGDEDTPQKLPASDFSDQAFDVGAPGDQVPSTITGNRFGFLSGTSQAAPFVTGAASLLMAKNHRLYPWEIKSRIIYTSDLHHDLLSFSKGGVLNISRALAYETDLIITKSKQELRGKLASGTKLTFTEDPNDSAQELNISQIKRIFLDQKTNSYILFVQNTGKKTLERKTGVIISSPAVLPFWDEKNVAHNLQLSDLADVIGRM